MRLLLLPCSVISDFVCLIHVTHLIKRVHIMVFIYVDSIVRLSSDHNTYLACGRVLAAEY